MSQVNLKQFAKNGRKIIGAVLNYKDCITDNAPETPILFLKAISSYVEEGKPIRLPRVFTKVYHEVELGVVIGQTCKNVSIEEASKYVGGYCLALDLTGMCYIGKQREKALPWDLGKGFDTATPVSRFITHEELPNPNDVRLWLKVNGQTRQDQSSDYMHFKIPELISYASKFMTLEPNDMILTGTPAGATTIKHGDVIEFGIGEIVKLKFDVQDD
ncbi:acylpyruvase FAHD1, mitochondrial [Phlebotomus papatasi]|uniref:acylpyruvase FAHD1, mitochondrial n=1 Tax=Phlebotomus papatasi TaxID=29031 RepID=UPI0024845939|nr:acylpyruvase FAHD1, mitochondrial [Phlebotomus papatasi]